MLIAAIQQVECVRGCGGKGAISTPEVIGVVAGLASLGVAFYAIKISLGSLRIAEEQHRVFLRDLAAHAELAVKIKSPASDGVIEISSPHVEIVWGIHVENEGDKAARHVHVAVGMPMFLREMQWVEGENDSLLSKKAGPYPVRRPFVDTNGFSHEMQVVSKVVDYIGRAGGFSRVSAVLDLPNVGDERSIPVELLASSDDLPRGVENVTSKDEVLVMRVG